MSAELWACPRCGAKLVTRNMSHSCGAYSVEGFLAGKGERARALYAGLVRLIGECGPYELAPAKTRVAFMTRVRFASVSELTDRGMILAFGLPRALDSARVRKVERYGSGWFHHYVRIGSPEELDEELRGWLCESREQMGERRRLVGPGSPPDVT